MWSSYLNMGKWVEAYWYGKNSKSWNYIESEGNVHPKDMDTLYNSTSTLTKLLSNVDSAVYQHYNCSNPSTRCFD